jgi:uracil-DNA glycosylase
MILFYITIIGYKMRLNILKPEEVIDNSWSVIKVARERAPKGWEAVFKDADNELKDVSEIVEADKTVNGRFYPNCKDLFKAFELTPLMGNPGVKVVIIGQDPYHSRGYDGQPQAQGLAFSVRRGDKIPPSLINIFKEIKSNDETFIPPTHGDLTGWARQGVLLLNSCLTVRPGDPGCHKEIWLGFVKKIINAILDQNPKCIFVLWGRKAQKIRKMLGERATVLEASHPSPLGAYKGFFGCDHFNLINTHLRESGQTPINWNLDVIAN